MVFISSVVIGYLAACVTSSAHLPQLWHVLKHRCAKDMSYAWLCIHITAAILWLVYGLMSGKWPLIMNGFLVAAVLSTLLVLKRSMKGCKLHDDCE